MKYFQRLGRDTLYDICEYLHLVPPKGSEGDSEEEFNQVGIFILIGAGAEACPDGFS